MLFVAFDELAEVTGSYELAEVTGAKLDSPVFVLQSGYPQRIEVIVYAAILPAAVDAERHVYRIAVAVYHFDGAYRRVVPTFCFEILLAIPASSDEVIA